MTSTKAKLEASLLATMADGEWYSTAELAKKLIYSQSNIRRLLAEAVAAGLVERSPRWWGNPWYTIIKEGSIEGSGQANEAAG